MKYVDEFFSLTCASDLMQTGLYKTPQQLEIACHALKAANEVRNRHHKGVTAICLGDDGSVGAMLAFRTNWNVLSFGIECRSDPKLVMADGREVQRLTLMRDDPTMFAFDGRKDATQTSHTIVLCDNVNLLTTVLPNICPPSDLSTVLYWRNNYTQEGCMSVNGRPDLHMRAVKDTQCQVGQPYFKFIVDHVKKWTKYPSQKVVPPNPVLREQWF